MSDINRGLDWARVPEPEQAELEARAKAARVRIEWTADDTAKVLAVFDGLDFREVGRLEWDWEHGWFFWKVGPDGKAHADGGDSIDVDPDSRLDFNNERVAIVRDEEPAIQSVKMAELRGRLNMHRDETRDLAVVGAKVRAKRWLPKYLAQV